MPSFAVTGGRHQKPVGAAGRPEISALIAHCSLLTNLHLAVNTRFLLPGDQLEGIGRFSHEVLQRLVAQHPEVTFHFLFDRPFDPKYCYAANVVPHVLPPPVRHPLLYLAWFEGAVALWLRRHRPAAFLSLDGLTTLATSVPRLTVLHDLAFHHHPQDVSWLQSRYYQYFIPRFVRACRQVITVSEATRQDIIRTYGLRPERVSVAYNAPSAVFQPLPPAPLALPAEQQATRRQFAGGQLYFMFVGALQPRKNLANLLRAFALFKQEQGAAASGVQLLIVGREAWQTGPIFTAFQQMTHGRDAVRFTGRVTDTELAALYRAALATVYVPYFEGFGLPIVEAQASGCPVLTASVTSMPEVAGPGGAVLANPLLPADIAAGLRRIWQEPALRAVLQERGAANLSRFSWARSAEAVWQAITLALREE